MALKFFDDTSSQKTTTPFLDEFIKKNKNLKENTFPIIEIRRVKSDKGFLVITEEFSCFIWKNAKVTGQLIEALEFYVNNSTGYELVVFLPDKKKADFKLGVNFEKEMTWFTSKNGYTLTQDGLDYPEHLPDKNPFLPD
jgi:hypothetical protein